MKKCVGNIEILGKSLKYYVFGSRSAGFGVEIIETHVERADQIVAQSFEKALSVAQILQNGAIFPANLGEIIDDLEFQRNSD